MLDIFYFLLLFCGTILVIVSTITAILALMTLTVTKFIPILSEFILRIKNPKMFNEN